MVDESLSQDSRAQERYIQQLVAIHRQPEQCGALVPKSFLDFQQWGNPLIYKNKIVWQKFPNL
jgi:hypothetical protein